MLSLEEKLILLVEECGEVIQAVTKCQRFGMTGNHPTYGVNHVRLAEEIGDLLGVIDSLPLLQEHIEVRRKAKIDRAIAMKEKYGRVG